MSYQQDKNKTGGTHREASLFIQQTSPQLVGINLFVTTKFCMFSEISLKLYAHEHMLLAGFEKE